ncbi:laccase domain-containing protein [Sporolactobacillus pectinivorans]|uniref:laccase domain-containing protein n=1 Tax=Sporolactobacillus pectinivorans TaxID=1591408 RepID=UPI0023D7E2B1|nr:laccase domain-containing protein [Sporolactobacillus pectinivorans]
MAPFSSLNLGFHVRDRSEDVVQNREILADHIGFPLRTWVCAEQVHEQILPGQLREWRVPGLSACRLWLKMSTVCLQLNLTCSLHSALQTALRSFSTALIR